ncbi:hypothetical protein Tco_1005560 [Tanacetum coccineum]|uniref:Uncharacterized protein n=1 Tax=Tanacetum coccineum TaxID=301880 RepID=A0ABQ5FFH5_9ASTR
MVSFQQLHSPSRSFNQRLKGSRPRRDSKRICNTLWSRSGDFQRDNVLYMDHYKAIDNEEFQEIGSMSAFKVLQTQFQMFIKSRFYLDDEYVGHDAHFLQYLTQGKKDKSRQQRKRLIRVMYWMHWMLVQLSLKAMGQNQKSRIQAADQGMMHMLMMQKSDPYMMKSQWLEYYDYDDNVSATGQQHTEQPEFINEGEVDQNAEQCHDISPLPAKLTDNMTTELSDQSLESKNQFKPRSSMSNGSFEPRQFKPRSSMSNDVVQSVQARSYQITSGHNRSKSEFKNHRQDVKFKSCHAEETGINPMIQPEPEDLPKDNPKLEIAVLRSVINELTSGEIVSLNFIESIKEARSRVQDLTSGEIVKRGGGLKFIESEQKLRSLTMELLVFNVVTVDNRDNIWNRTR